MELADNERFEPPEDKHVSVLEIENLGIRFGGLVAVDGFSLSLGKGELVGIIGPNGAGKTTIFNMITGVYKPTSGSSSNWPSTAKQRS